MAGIVGIVGSLKAIGKAVASSLTSTSPKKGTDKKDAVGSNSSKSSGKKITSSRSGINNAITRYIKASLPRPQAGKLVSRDQSEVNKKRISAGFNNANFSNMHTRACTTHLDMCLLFILKLAWTQGRVPLNDM